MMEKFLYHGQKYFTIQDLMDEVGHEIQRMREIEKSSMASVVNQITLLRMFKSDLRNLVKRYERLESMIK